MSGFFSGFVVVQKYKKSLLPAILSRLFLELREFECKFALSNEQNRGLGGV
jgi:hypothetical protein